MSNEDEREEMPLPLDMLDRIHKVDTKAENAQTRLAQIQSEQKTMWDVIDGVKTNVTRIVAIGTVAQIVLVPIIVVVINLFLKKG